MEARTWEIMGIGTSIYRVFKKWICNGISNVILSPHSNVWNNIVKLFLKHPALPVEVILNHNYRCTTWCVFLIHGSSKHCARPRNTFIISFQSCKALFETSCIWYVNWETQICFAQCTHSWQGSMNDKWHFTQNSRTLCVLAVKWVRERERMRIGPYANIQSQCDEISFVVWGGLLVQMVDLRVSQNCC
jgi:hypothetical protein